MITIKSQSIQISNHFIWKSSEIKGDGGVGTFGVGGGGPAFIFGSNLPIFWVHA